jgi:hypothetical protein
MSNGNRASIQRFSIRESGIDKNRYFSGFIWRNQGVTKSCRLFYLTNSALVYEPKDGGRGEGCTVHTEPLKKTKNVLINVN